MNAYPTNNVTGKFNTISSVYYPQKLVDVQTLIQQCRSTGIPLYPISKGFNWGYGSRSPTASNCALVDLSRMNRILNAEAISLNNPIAIIEPGVTQLQLYEFLQKNVPELTFNVTGSSKDTSIIGNALDRGVGYLGPRKNDLFGLEVVTGTGEILRTGFRRLGDSSPLAQTHPFGLGPILDGLFFQSNFGIVTSACLKLLPRRPKETVISFHLYKNDDLSNFIQELIQLKYEGLLTSVTHIANHIRSRTTLAYGIANYLENECGLCREAALKETDKALNIIISEGWTSLSTVTGTHAQVKVALKEIRSRMQKFGKVRVITNTLLTLGFNITHALRSFSIARTHAAAISAMRPLHGLALGVPTDIAIENLLWKFNHPNIHAAELDKSRCGLLFINPALPSNGKIISETVKNLESIAKNYGHILYMTINIETETSLVAIVNLLFDRSISEETARAHKCADALLEYIHRKGLEVYRVRADMMNKITAINPDYWEKIHALKQIFDPDNIISPGRYNL